MDGWPHVLERAVESARNSVLITDPIQPDNPIVYANPAFERISGYSAEEILGRNCRFLQRHDTDQPALEEVRMAIREGRECRVVVRNYRKNGALFWQELSISPVRDSGGRITHFVGIQDDVTERRLVEERVVHQASHEDTAARLGGDEFWVLLEGVRSADATGTAEKILEALREPFVLGEAERSLTASIGVALGRPGSGTEQPQDLLRSAELSMYRSKRNGKASYTAFGSGS